MNSKLNAKVALERHTLAEHCGRIQVLSIFARYEVSRSQEDRDLLIDIQSLPFFAHLLRRTDSFFELAFAGEVILCYLVFVVKG